MEQEIPTSNTQVPYTAVSELTVIKENKRDTDTNLYVQILRALPGSITAGNITTPFINLPLDRAGSRNIKRGVDIIFSLLVIVGILSWLIPLLAIIIKLDSRGPVFFLQKRNKRNGGIFTCIKFRSMIVNPEADVLPAARFDKRITRVGRFMRRNYMDELPQFFNVLWGDMSVVGPRPHMLSDNMKYQEEVEYYGYRHKVKPGITGLAQVMGFVGATDEVRKMKDRVNMDNFYLRHWSLRMDIVIMFRTLTRALGF
jgi:putative colanic acid biosynthesis UDP-glucose lipid carrier transferase